MPSNPLERYRLLYRVMQQGLVRACHDLSEGGLAIALAEMCLAGRLGATAEIARLRETAPALTAQELLFSESNGRLLLEVRPEDAAAVETQLSSVPLISLGVVTAAPTLTITDAGQPLIALSVEQLVNTWKQQV